jgi:hypothetical protein
LVTVTDTGSPVNMTVPVAPTGPGETADTPLTPPT